MRNLPEIVATFAVAAAALAAGGCIESVDSGSLETDGLWADFKATADESHDTRIEAGLKTEGPGSNTYANLSGGDGLTFYVNGEAREPEPDKSFGTEYAYTRMVSESAGGTTIQIEFHRQSGTDAPDSVVRLPDEFDIEAPERDDTFSRSLDDVWLKLDDVDPETEMHVDVEGPCLEDDYENDFVGRSITIPREELESDDRDDERRCDVDVTVEARRTGRVDPAYEGGEFVAKQVRETSFRSVP